MSLRQKLMVVLGATLLAAACSSPTSPRRECSDIITLGSSRCAVSN